MLIVPIRVVNQTQVNRMSYSANKTTIPLIYQTLSLVLVAL
ncbi:hypothetical protein BAZSYMA_ACONTIG06588_11 [Bathymodiolus azoricus thioautotrophic gill symbiont]|uniref:Uncharacterized protein n=1 Tax=Bathymodiolus azoricus thioautotrophic gill symbiont TaxID=235205 RepID=A0A1H6KLM0_9GAMM|nr:hypothetical protein BAZSYMA_ACONTIG06588_11 [Bathymodiolus azoricus thioautotrophic gill symbiont]